MAAVLKVKPDVLLFYPEVILVCSNSPRVFISPTLCAKSASHLDGVR